MALPLAIRALSAIAVAGLMLEHAIVEAQPGLSAAEIEKLQRGELVSRPIRLRRAGLDLIGGSSWQQIEAPIDVVWRALHDVGRYTSMLPNVRDSRVVLERIGGQRLIFVEHGNWPISPSYYVWLEIDSYSHRIDFRLDPERPHSLDAGWGSVQLIALDGGRTLVVWSALVDVGRGLLATLAQPLIQPWMLRVPSTLKWFLESGGRAHYAQGEGVP